jgi:hypothetical protein
MKNDRISAVRDVERKTTVLYAKAVATLAVDARLIARSRMLIDESRKLLVSRRFLSRYSK